jgi:hypothetical protein
VFVRHTTARQQRGGLTTPALLSAEVKQSAGYSDAACMHGDLIKLNSEVPTRRGNVAAPARCMHVILLPKNLCCVCLLAHAPSPVPMLVACPADTTTCTHPLPLQSTYLLLASTARVGQFLMVS